MTNLFIYIPCECGKNCGKMVYQNPKSSIKNKIHPSCQYRDSYDKTKASKSKDSFFTGKKTKPQKTKLDFYSTSAWINCSHYILTYYADNDGNVQCATSNRWMHVTDNSCHCGHFIKVQEGTKTNYAVAFDFINLAPQFSQDNVNFGGRPEVMRKWLIKKHGLKAIEELEIKQHNICKLDKISLNYWACFYKEQLRLLLEERGIKDFWKNKHKH